MQIMRMTKAFTLRLIVLLAAHHDCLAIGGEQYVESVSEHGSFRSAGKIAVEHPRGFD